MKTTLAYDQRAAQFKCDVGKPAKRFYLGSDSTTAQARKLALVELWQQTKATSEEWTDEALKLAEAIRKGEGVKVLQDQGEADEAYLRRLEKTARATSGKVRMQITATTDDDLIPILMRRVATLESIVRETRGEGVLVGSNVSIHAALDEWHRQRLASEIDPDTQAPTEHVRTEGNNINLIKRVVENMPLSRLGWIELQSWCKAIANRPVSLKTGKPIKRLTARNALKVIRQFVKWASRNYGWKKPEDWHEATLAMLRQSTEERRERIGLISKHYTPEEIGTLWRFALPSERMLILLGLNFAYLQSDILRMIPDDVAGEYVAAIRGKSTVLGKWLVWEETRELAKTEFAGIPKRRQHIADRWTALLDRVCKDISDFKRLSFKWLRKTGASIIRAIAGGEVASTYISHGERATTDDKLLEIYAATDWNSVCAALVKFRELLLPHLQAEAVTTRSNIPRTKIDQIKDGWKAGLKWKDIKAQTGVSRATAYRYKVTSIGEEEQ